MGALVWIPLTILALRVMAGMGLAQNAKMMRLEATPTWAHRISAWLRRIIYRGE